MSASVLREPVATKTVQVRYLRQEEKLQSRALYEEMFPEDEESFVEAYYKIKGACNRILVLEEGGELRSMLHLNPYRFWMRGEIVECSYFVAVATRPLYRHQGYMRCLLIKALQDLYERRQPFAFLMPAKEAIYTPFGFRKMENEDGEILGKASGEELSQGYDLFVWKDEDYKRQHIPAEEWETTPMMQRIVYLPGLLGRIGAREPVEILLHITDQVLTENAGTYRWSLGERGSVLHKLGQEAAFEGQAAWKEKGQTSLGEKTGREALEFTVDIGDLGSFLFGSQSISQLFPQVSAELKKKLEKIRIFEKIFLNEVV
ncbi:MAG: GNAT family N-acetyltransferase [Lachnospiraceae bacterium]|nr:GNAT family N-acetyltransferase [Lachnospiraceae bacterium]